MNEKVQDIRGLSALLIGNKSEHPGKKPPVNISLFTGTLIPHWFMGLGRIQHLAARNNV